MSTKIKALSATAGFLQNCKVEFAEGFTCIIGARGTCKSTLVESIRFAFDCDSDRVRQHTGAVPSTGEPYYGLIRETLGPGSVRCEVVTDSATGQEIHVLEREVGDEPRIFIGDVREHADRSLIGGIEIYSQGDLQRIADDKNEQMRLDLIDRPHAAEINKLRSQRAMLRESLLKLGPQLRTVRSQILGLRQQTHPLASLREQLKQVVASSPELPPELETERLAYEKRGRVVNAVKDAAALRTIVSDMLSAVPRTRDELRSLVRQVTDHQLPGTDETTSALEEFGRSLDEVIAQADQISRLDLNAEAVRISEVFERQNDSYYRIRQEQQAINEALKQQQHLQKQIDTLERVQNELDAVLLQEQALLHQRQSIRASVEAVDDAMYRRRLEEIDRINNQHQNQVFLALETGTGSSSYYKKLMDMLGGSGIRFREEVALSLSNTFPAATLIDVIESGNGQTFSQVLGRDIGQMNRVVSHLIDHGELYRLEAEPPSMRLAITFYDEGQPKSVEELSKGQKATALLPLILRPLPYPLIIDQPEDDLDNSFIFNSLIREVQNLKGKRQLIFVTHNANIPVLGNADRIVVMSMATPSEARQPISGTVEECKQHILDLLEGGKDAFNEREARYGDLLLDRDGG